MLTLAQWRIQGGAAVPLLTGCILKQVKIFHKNALFLIKKISKIFLGVNTAPPPQALPPTLPPFYSKFLGPPLRLRFVFVARYR